LSVDYAAGAAGVAPFTGRRWSPQQIAGTLKLAFPDWPEMWVSHETIYQSLYVQSRGALRRELVACLRTGRALRKPAGRIVQVIATLPAQLRRSLASGRHVVREVDACRNIMMPRHTSTIRSDMTLTRRLVFGTKSATRGRLTSVARPPSPGNAAKAVEVAGRPAATCGQGDHPPS
jgi:hypothetical protein